MEKLLEKEFAVFSAQKSQMSIRMGILSDCIEKNLENSEAVCFNNSGLFCLYMNADTLFTYNIATKEKKSIFTFNNPMMYSVELKLKNNILTLIYYSNLVEDFSDLNSAAKVINFEYQE